MPDMVGSDLSFAYSVVVYGDWDDDESCLNDPDTSYRYIRMSLGDIDFLAASDEDMFYYADNIIEHLRRELGRRLIEVRDEIIYKTPNQAEWEV